MIGKQVLGLDGAIILVFQGIQTNELDTLTVNDIDFTKAKICIRPKGSRGNVRTLSLEAAQVSGFMYYLHVMREQLITQPTDKLFLPEPKYQHPNDQHKQTIMPALRLLHQSLKKLHKDYRKMTQLRTSVITHWIKNLGLRKAQVLAGHKSIVSTEEYVHNDLESLIDDINKFNPF
jgi:site-specific recombinase XerD